MTGPQSQLDRFVRAVHRRVIVLRALEGVGIASAIGSAAALALVPLLMWRGRPALPVACLLLGVAALSGLIWGLIRRPTALQAAMEADRQLYLADLLGTAMSVRSTGTATGDGAASGDPWQGAVLAVAEARCAQLSPSSLVLHRLGVRAWGGIGMGAALALTLATLASAPASHRAMAAQSRFLSPGQLADAITAANTPPASPRAVGARPPEQPPRRDLEAESADASPLGSAAVTGNRAASEDDGERRAVSGSDPAGRGTGLGRTPADRSVIPPIGTPDAAERTPGTTGIASGGGRSGNGVEGQSGVSSASAAPAPPGHAAPRWQPGDSADGQATPSQGAAREANAVPDAYRDLVREFLSAGATRR